MDTHLSGPSDFYVAGEEATPAQQAAEDERARRLAERYRLEFVDMVRFRIDNELFRSIPADLMLRYSFVPFRRDGQALLIVVSDPTDLPMIDELSALLGTPVKVAVGTPSAIQSILKKSESSQRVLEEATEGFQMQILREDENLEESLTVERLTSDKRDVPVFIRADAGATHQAVVTAMDVAGQLGFVKLNIATVTPPEAQAQ